jgi:hypothetical protein
VKNFFDRISKWFAKKKKTKYDDPNYLAKTYNHPTKELLDRQTYVVMELLIVNNLDNLVFAYEDVYTRNFKVKVHLLDDLFMDLISKSICFNLSDSQFDGINYIVSILRYTSTTHVAKLPKEIVDTFLSNMRVIN